MVIKSIISFFGKRVLAALGVLAAAFATFMIFRLNAWWFVGVSVLFITYVSWTATAFFATQQNFSGRRIMACVVPVGIATLQTLVCLGSVWLIVWSVRHVFER